MHCQLCCHAWPLQHPSSPPRLALRLYVTAGATVIRPPPTHCHQKKVSTPLTNLGWERQE